MNRFWLIRLRYMSSDLLLLFCRRFPHFTQRFVKGDNGAMNELKRGSIRIIKGQFLVWRFVELVSLNVLSRKTPYCPTIQNMRQGYTTKQQALADPFVYREMRKRMKTLVLFE